MANKPDSRAGAGGTAAVCYKLAEPLAKELGFVLWDVRFLKEGTTWYLRVFIDKAEGDVSIDDCVAMSRRLDKLLDQADPISQSYCLEVCSPGIERELTRPEHFALCEGWPVAVKLIRPIDGVREFAGILLGYENNVLRIETEEGEELSFAKKDTSAVHLIDEWDDDIDGGETENDER